MQTIVFLILVSAIQTSQIIRIDASSPTLTSADELFSTLGSFKVALEPKNCSLGLSQFISTNYTSQGYYSANISTPCSSLTLNGPVFANENNQTFLRLPEAQYRETYLVLDDYGVIHLVGLIAGGGYRQVTMDSKRQGQTYIYIVNQTQQIPNITNLGGWSFSLSNSQLTISGSRGQSIFEIPQLSLTPTGIVDSNNLTLPYARTDALSFPPSCSLPHILYYPFVLEIDPFWPQITFYDQSRYQILSLGLSKHSSCPSSTFQLNHTCVTTCPPPFFHQAEGPTAACVLNCRWGALQDMQTRQCTCPNYPADSQQAFPCIGNSAYLLGCVCSNGTYFDPLAYQCRSECPEAYQPYEGVCVSCGDQCLQCQIDGAFGRLLSCISCQQGYVLKLGECLLSPQLCSQGCLTCIKNQCLTCQPLFTLVNRVCARTCPTGLSLLPLANLTFTCITSNATKTPLCPQGCLLCTGNSCTLCLPGYTLSLSPFLSSCRLSTPFLACNPPYTLNSLNLCLPMALPDSLTMCRQQVTNCQACLPYDQTNCVLCSQGLILQENSCVKACSQGSQQLNQGCWTLPTSCKLGSFNTESTTTTINWDLYQASQSYQWLIAGGIEPANEPYGYPLYLRNQHLFQQDNSSLTAIFYKTNPYCLRCKDGQGVNSLGECRPCLPPCLLCLATNNSCLASTLQQLLLYSPCSAFIDEEGNCRPSCPSQTSPGFSSDGQPACLPLNAGPPALTVEASSFQLSPGQYLHRFVFNRQISFGRRLQANQSDQLSQDGFSMSILGSKSTGLLDLRGQLTQLNAGGSLPANSVYGVSIDQSYATWANGWLARIGQILSLILIVAHCLFLAVNLPLKLDNLLILVQTFYFCIFIRTLPSNPLAQFLNGWNWANISFFPNYFALTLDFRRTAPPTYYLLTGDANFIRNAGSTLSFFLTFLALMLLTAIVLLVLYRYGRRQAWHPRLLATASLAIIQFLSYPLLYWSIASMNYDTQSSDGTFIGLAVLILVLSILYTLVRLFITPIFGIYMLKRLLLASVLASSYSQPSYVTFIAFLELLFLAARFYFQHPSTRFKIIILIAEQGLIIILYLLLYLTTSAGVISILATLFVYIWLLMVVGDLSEIYLASQNQELPPLPQLFTNNHESTEKWQQAPTETHRQSLDPD